MAVLTKMLRGYSQSFQANNRASPCNGPVRPQTNIHIPIMSELDSVTLNNP